MEMVFDITEIPSTLDNGQVHPNFGLGETQAVYQQEIHHTFTSSVRSETLDFQEVLFSDELGLARQTAFVSMTQGF